VSFGPKLLLSAETALSFPIFKLLTLAVLKLQAIKIANSIPPEIIRLDFGLRINDPFPSVLVKGAIVGDN
jgi:hypothetical protein